MNEGELDLLKEDLFIPSNDRDSKRSEDALTNFDIKEKLMFEERDLLRQE